MILRNNPFQPTHPAATERPPQANIAALQSDISLENFLKKLPAPLSDRRL
jgi:hypothetical protein